jgi:hypothetical protein
MLEAVVMKCFNKLLCEQKSEVNGGWEASHIEAFLCYLSIIVWGIFSVRIFFLDRCWIWNGFRYEHLLLLFPPVLWMLLRISRKNMDAAAYLIGAIAGAITLFLIKYWIGK